ncbi:MAG TPA: alkaline phosphatase D family protein [Abditibacterium sp.]|jgi:phosphodiesterase/alkaline phosphatase D-like protein
MKIPLHKLTLQVRKPLIIAALALGIAVNPLLAQSAPLIDSGASWKYLDNGSSSSAAWRTATFDDAAWASGAAELGYGDGDEKTVVSFGQSAVEKHVTTYFRRVFQVPNAAAYQGLMLNLKRDDGAIVYLNGTEIHRSNMPDGAVNSATLATNPVDGATEMVTATLPTTGLVSGNNVIAVEIHQATVNSSDISFSLALTGTPSAASTTAPINTPADGSSVSVTHGPWSGGVTASSARVKARLSQAGATARLVVSTAPDLRPATYSAVATAEADKDNVVDVSMTGLEANTTYYYGFEINGALSTDSRWRGRFKTFPAGAASFKFAFGSCGGYKEAGQDVYDAIKGENPLFFLSMGDFHYNDTNSPRVSDYWNDYKGILSTVHQASLLRDFSMAYVWDDHDSAGDGANKTSVGIPNAQQAYRHYVPSYPLATASGPINQAFNVGRARFILSDLRSQLDRPGDPDSANKSTMGAVQKAWLKSEFLAAKNSGAKVIFWVSSFPFIASPSGTDNWGSYTVERREIADFLKANNIRNVVILSGDMHALAYDDGTNSDYATGGGLPLHVAHAAALARRGSVKGGPYTVPAIPGTGQYGMMEVTDNGGDSIGLRFIGKHYKDGIKIDRSFSFPASPAKQG